MAFGTVYVFNLYDQPASLKDLNGNGPPANAPIAPPQKGNQAPYWTPSQAGVSRTNLNLSQLEDPLFVQAPDVNSLRIDYGGQNWLAHVTIPLPPHPNLETDLWLYLAYQQAILFDSADGSVLATSLVQAV